MNDIISLHMACGIITLKSSMDLELSSGHPDLIFALTCAKHAIEDVLEMEKTYIAIEKPNIIVDKHAPLQLLEGQ